MNITFSFTARLTIIALISFLVFFFTLMFIVYEFGKQQGIKTVQESKNKISVVPGKKNKPELNK